MSDEIVLYCCRYMWKMKDSERVCFKIVTDTLEGLASFECVLRGLDGIEHICYEYLCEYDCSRLGTVVPVNLENENNSEVNDNEKV